MRALALFVASALMVVGCDGVATVDLTPGPTADPTPAVEAPAADDGSDAAPLDLGDAEYAILERQCFVDFDTCVARGVDTARCEDRLDACMGAVADQRARAEAARLRAHCADVRDRCAARGGTREQCTDLAQDCLDTPTRPTPQDSCRDLFQACVDAGHDERACRVRAQSCLDAAAPAPVSDCDRAARACAADGWDADVCQLQARVCQGTGDLLRPGVIDTCQDEQAACLRSGAAPERCESRFTTCLGL